MSLQNGSLDAELYIDASGPVQLSLAYFGRFAEFAEPVTMIVATNSDIFLSPDSSGTNSPQLHASSLRSSLPFICDAHKTSNALRHFARFGLAVGLVASPANAMVGGALPVNGPNTVVMIVGSRGNSCTGVAIARDLVLTAAHCVPAGVDTKLVEFDAQRQPRLRDVQSVARHPQFSQKTFDNHRATADVALLKFAAPVSTAPARIQAKRLQIAPGDRLSVTGFGLTRIGDGKSGGTLRSAVLAVTGQPGNLQVRLMDPVTRNERPGLGACTGDSGAPVFRETGETRKVVGVVSWSTGPGNAEGCGGLTGVTPLSLYYPWIAETARKLGSTVIE